jgi:hypothetical protein
MTDLHLKDQFTHMQYGKFERFRSAQAITFVDAVRQYLQRGNPKTWTKTTKNYVRWTPQPNADPLCLSLGTWAEIHALFNLTEAQLQANELHLFLSATAQTKPDHTPT